jgi:hypothetical protein
MTEQDGESFVQFTLETLAGTGLQIKAIFNETITIHVFDYPFINAACLNVCSPGGKLPSYHSPRNAH